MKWYMKGIVGALALSLVVSLAPTPAQARVDVDVSFGFFYDNLTPHGSWYVSSQYGRVWQPSVYRSDWNPYYDGHWEYTDYGWTWVSDYDWGSVPYHYGTWVLDVRYGWVWVPGYTWAPAWVVFRTGNDYCGWAPVPPGWSLGASINLGPSAFVFVSTRDFLSPRIGHVVLSPARTRVVVQQTRIINNITIQNNVVVNRGPDVRAVERATHRRVVQQPIERVARVAPFERVSRDRLQVAPDQARNRRVRAAEPYSADRPLPERGRRQEADRRPDRRDDRSDGRGVAPTPQPRASRDVDDRTRTRTDVAARDRARARDDEQARMDTRQRQQAERTRSEERARMDAEARQRQQQADRQQRTRSSQEQARADADARQRQQQAEREKARASADAKAKAQAEARAKAKRDAERKKKQEEDKKNDSGNQ